MSVSLITYYQQLNSLLGTTCSIQKKHTKLNKCEYLYLCIVNKKTNKEVEMNFIITTETPLYTDLKFKDLETNKNIYWIIRDELPDSKIEDIVSFLNT